jgi:DNA-binding NarL/FixJ family response regulator
MCTRGVVLAHVRAQVGISGEWSLERFHCGVTNIKRPIRVLVADDHGLMREAIRLALEPECDIEVAAEAERGDEVLARVRQTRPDVLLLDIRMPGMDGLEVLSLVRAQFPDVKVAMLSALDEPRVAAEALERGAIAYLGKRVTPSALISTIRGIMDGSVSMQTLGLPDGAKTHAAKEAALSPREVEILRRVASGRSNREIAQELWLSEQTVKYHLTNVYRKIRVNGRSDATRYAYEHALAERYSA